MKKIELLAPAGGRAQFIAAVENGRRIYRREEFQRQSRRSEFFR